MFTRMRSANWLLLVAAALLVRALVPQGFMVSEAGDGAIAIAVCNSDVQITIPVKGDGDRHEGADNAAQHCVFAGHQSAAAPPVGTATLPLPQAAHARYDRTREQALSPPSPRRLPPARGPPASA